MDLLKNFFSKYEFRRKSVHFVLGILFVVFINLDNYFVKEQLELLLVIALFLALCVSIYTQYKRPRLILQFLYRCAIRLCHKCGRSLARWDCGYSR